MDAIDSINALETRQTDVTRTINHRTNSIGNVQAFDSALSTQSVGGSNSTQATSQSDAATKKLQAMFISQIVGELFKEQTDSTFGEGTQGDFYASVFSDAIAKQLAERDVLGLDKMLGSK